MTTTTLTDEQRAAVSAVLQAVQSPGHGPHFVLEAVAGSGKTHTLVSMVERLRSERSQKVVADQPAGTCTRRPHSDVAVQP